MEIGPVISQKGMAVDLHNLGRTEITGTGPNNTSLIQELGEVNMKTDPRSLKSVVFR